MVDVPEFKLVPEPASAEASAMTYNEWSSPEIGTRHKIGGQPDVIRKDDWPRCPSCQETMSFYGQFDSLNDKEGRFDLADCGLLYVFVCFDCFESASFVQSF